MNASVSATCALAFCVLLLGPAWSQQAATELQRVEVTGEPLRTTDRLPLDSLASTGSRLGLTPRETPARIHIITSEPMRDEVHATRSYGTVKQVLLGEPGALEISYTVKFQP